MRCVSPFDNGSYHMGTIRTNRTNRQLAEGFLGLHRVRNILSPPNEIQFSIRQRVVSHGHDLYESTATAQPFYDSYLFRCIGQPSQTFSFPHTLHCFIKTSLFSLFSGHWFLALIFDLPTLVGESQIHKRM